MKKNSFIFLLVFISPSFLRDQKIRYGIKAGINYQKVNKVILEVLHKRMLYKNKGKGPIGWHGGTFIRLDFPKGILKGELMYDGLFNSFAFQDKPLFNSVIHRITFSPSLGVRMHRYFHMYVGPTFSFNVINTMDLDFIREDAFDRWVAVIYVGSMFLLSNFIFELRWERDLSPFKTTYSNMNRKLSIDNRASFFKAAIGYQF